MSLKAPTATASHTRREGAPPRGRTVSALPRDTSGSAFTLIEILICISIIFLLMALMLPAIQMVREQARATACRNNLTQLGIALHNYHDMHRTFPPGYISAVNALGTDLGPGWGWSALLLHLLEQTNISDSLRFEDSPRAPGNTTAVRYSLEIMLCPSDASAVAPSQFNYVASFGRGNILLSPDQGDGVFFRNSRIRIKDIEDGALTFLLGERTRAGGWAEWFGVMDVSFQASRRPANALPIMDRTRVLGHTGMREANPAVHPPGRAPGCSADYDSAHPAGAHFLLLDGSVRFVSDQVDGEIFAALASRAGAEPVTGAEF